MEKTFGLPYEITYDYTITQNTSDNNHKDIKYNIKAMLIKKKRDTALSPLLYSLVLTLSSHNEGLSESYRSEYKVIIPTDKRSLFFKDLYNILGAIGNLKNITFPWEESFFMCLLKRHGWSIILAKYWISRKDPLC